MRWRRRQPVILDAQIAQLQEHPRLRGKRTREVPEMAWVRYRFRRECYHWADLFFGLSFFGLILIAAQDGWGRWASIVGFCCSFPMMFRSEFKARTMTRQLNRSAAEQVARDLVGIRD